MDHTPAHPGIAAGSDDGVDYSVSTSDNGSAFLTHLTGRNSISSFYGRLVDLFLSLAEDVVRKEPQIGSARLAQELEKDIRARFPEFSHIDMLRKQRHAVVERPEVSYRESGLPYEQYLRTYFATSIARGYLPVAEIDDEPLRRRISVEKSRGLFPSDLSEICLTQGEMLERRRRAVACLADFDDIESKEFVAFARGIFPQQRAGTVPSHK